MAGQVDGGYITAYTTSAISAGTGVAISSTANYVSTAVTASRTIGICQNHAAADDLVNIKLLNDATDEIKLVATIVTRGDVLYQGVNGQFATTGDYATHIAMDGGVAGDIIQAARL